MPIRYRRANNWRNHHFSTVFFLKIERNTVPKISVKSRRTTAKAAESFGFPEFLPFEETGLALTEEETNDKETFGYWCRDVRGSEDCADIQRKI